MYNEDRRLPPTSCRVCTETSQPEISLQCGCAFHRGCFDQGLLRDFGTTVPSLTMHNYCCRFCRDSGRSDDYFSPLVYLWHSESYPNVRVVDSNFQGHHFPWEASAWDFANDPLYPPASTEDRVCGICQDEIELENMNSYAAVITRCNHKFHTTCLSRSLVFQERGTSHRLGSRGTCPMCRGSVDEVYTGAIASSYEAWKRIRNSRGLQRIIFNVFSEVRGEEEEIHSPERFPYRT